MSEKTARRQVSLLDEIKCRLRCSQTKKEKVAIPAHYGVPLKGGATFIIGDLSGFGLTIVKAFERDEAVVTKQRSR